MNWRNIKLIWWREVLDQLRDKRTLFMVAILPILLYPALGLGMLEMMLIFSAQPKKVVLLGEADLPQPALLNAEGSQFDPLWFGEKGLETVEVITDKPWGETSGEAGKDDTQKESEKKDDVKEQPEDVALALKKATAIRKLLSRLETIEKQLDDFYSQPAPETASEQEKQKNLLLIQKARDDRDQIRTQIRQLFFNSGFDVLIVIPENFRKRIEEENEKLKNRSEDVGTEKPTLTTNYPRPIVLQNSANEKSETAYLRVKNAIDTWELAILKSRLNEAQLPASLPKPVNVMEVDIAEPDQVAANVWAKLFPAMLVIMALTGAFYPAVDLAAGEKERGTMETLLICPASRGEIVIGKFLTVFLFSMGTALLNLLSMGLTGQHMLSQASGGLSPSMGDMTFPGMMAIVWVVLLAIPLATLFSALSLALAIFAKSSKEGQYYLSPLLLVTMGLTVFCLSPAVEMTPFYSILPVMGPALLLKGLLSGQAVVGIWGYAVPVLVTSFSYSFLALWWAVEQFRREDIIFRESEQFSLQLWLKKLWEDKGEVPTFAKALFCFVAIMMTQFIAMSAMKDILAAIAGSFGNENETFAPMILATQVVMIAGPAVLLGLLLTTNFRKTFRLNFPKLRYIILAPLLAITLHPIVVDLSHAMSGFFPPIPDSVMEQFRSMSSSGDTPLWMSIALIALTPAICEELAFRGFILSGLSSNKRYGIAIVLSSVMFGIMHMIPSQVFNATLLGMVIGLIAVKSNSLLPCVLFHFTNNAIAVLHGRTEEWETVPENLSLFVSASGEGLEYRIPTLIICCIIGSTLIAWLLKQPVLPTADDKGTDEKIENHDDTKTLA